MEECLFCKEIAKARDGKNEYFVAELKTGYVFLSWHQYFEGYAIFAYKDHVSELHQLENDSADEFLHEMRIVVEAVQHAFNPKVLNYAKLGNKDPHMHWHIIPRYGTDPAPQNTIWNIPNEVWASDEQKPTPEKLTKLKELLKKELDQLIIAGKH